MCTLLLLPEKYRAILFSRVSTWPGSSGKGGLSASFEVFARPSLSLKRHSLQILSQTLFGSKDWEIGPG